MNNMNYLEIDSLRLEIAVLQETIDSLNPGTHKFKIPVLMTEDTVANIATSNANITNRRNGNITGSTINIDNTISLKVPKEYTVYYGDRYIPAGTRFIVAFVGGNINDIKIIARYD